MRVAIHERPDQQRQHRIFPRTPEGQALNDQLLVSIDLSEITFA
jgi:hypothetical protein